MTNVSYPISINSREILSAAAAADHGAHGLVGAEIVGAIDIKQGAEFRPPRLTRLLMVPTAQPQIVAASS